jgi:hypothetical protein
VRRKRVATTNNANLVIFWMIYAGRTVSLGSVYLDAHAEWEGEGGDDEKDGDEGEQQGAAPRALRVSCKKRKQMYGNDFQKSTTDGAVRLILNTSFYRCTVHTKYFSM